jgi:hypothetical protein
MASYDDDATPPLLRIDHLEDSFTPGRLDKTRHSTSTGSRISLLNFECDIRFGLDGL